MPTLKNNERDIYNENRTIIEWITPTSKEIRPMWRKRCGGKHRDGQECEKNYGAIYEGQK